MCVCVCVLVTQLCLILCNPKGCSPPGSSVHGILQATILEWVAIPFSRGSSQLRDQIQVSWIAGGFFTIWATRKAPLKCKNYVLSHFSCIRLFATYGLQPARLLCPWDFPSKKTGVRCLFLFQGIIMTQALNPCLLCLLHWQADSFPLVPPGKIVILKVTTPISLASFGGPR